jgi:hypothetical protein
LPGALHCGVAQVKSTTVDERQLNMLFNDEAVDSDDFWSQLYDDGAVGKKGRGLKAEKKEKIPKEKKEKVPKEKKEKVPKEKKEKVPKEKKDKVPKDKKDKGVTQLAFVSDVHGQYVTALKRIRAVDLNALEYIRVANPAHPSQRIAPYVPEQAQETKCVYIEVCDDGSFV